MYAPLKGVIAPKGQQPPVGVLCYTVVWCVHCRMKRKYTNSFHLRVIFLITFLTHVRTDLGANLAMN